MDYKETIQSMIDYTLAYAPMSEEGQRVHAKTLRNAKVLLASLGEVKRPSIEQMRAVKAVLCAKDDGWNEALEEVGRLLQEMKRPGRSPDEGK